MNCMSKDLYVLQALVTVLNFSFQYMGTRQSLLIKTHVLKTHMIDTFKITQVSRLRSNRLNTFKECLVNTYHQFTIGSLVCFVDIDISHHTVLDPVSNKDGVQLKPVPSINPDNMAPTSCWQQIRKNLIRIVFIASIVIAAVFAIVCGFTMKN